MIRLVLCVGYAIGKEITSFEMKSLKEVKKDLK